MATLFSVTAPLMIRYPGGEKKVMVERFPHPEGLLFFEAFWHLGDPKETVHVVPGPIKGDGPWKVGNAVVHVLGCHNVDYELADEFAAWRQYLQENPEAYPAPTMIKAIARARGALVDSVAGS